MNKPRAMGDMEGKSLPLPSNKGRPPQSEAGAQDDEMLARLWATRKAAMKWLERSVGGRNERA